MKKLYITLALLLCITLHAQEFPNSSLKHDNYTFTLEELSQIIIVSATREPISYFDSPSPVTVFTEEQIERYSLQNLEDILQRTPGFFTVPGTFELRVGNRGFVQKGQNYLLLLDGHNMNFASRADMGLQPLFPFNHDLKQVEIIRGPGSTLWGSNAAFGTINMISKTGSDIDLGLDDFGTLVLHTDYEFNENRSIANIQYGKSWAEERDLILSLTFLNSDGDIYRAYDADKTAIRVSPNFSNAFSSIEPSTRLYSKLRYDDWALTLYNMRFFIGNGGGSSTMNNSEARYAIRHTFAEVSFQPQLSETLFLENRLWYDDKSHRQENTKADPSGATTARDPDFLIRSDYQSYGLESILKFKTYKNTFLLGGSFEQNRFPGIFERLADANNGIPSTPFFLSKKGNENLIAFFAEDEFRPNEDWIMTLGLRYDEDDFRTNEQSWSPRFALLHRLNEEFSLKYSFNSGFVRPTLYVNRASIADRLPEQDPRRVGTIDFISGANKGQTVQSHDLQASYHDDSTLVTLTLFYTTVEDYIVERAKTVDIGSDTYRFIAFNGGEVTSKGLELEWYQGLTESLSLYMNYSYAMGKFADKVVTIPGGVDVDLIATKKVTDGKRIAGPPVHIWNLGFEYFPTDDVSMNLHYRGWADTQTMTATTTQSYSTYGPQHYVDFSLHIHNFLTPKLKLQLYIKNIFDNENGNHQDAQTEIGGREGGIALSYVF